MADEEAAYARRSEGCRRRQGRPRSGTPVHSPRVPSAEGTGRWHGRRRSRPGQRHVGSRRSLITVCRGPLGTPCREGLELGWRARRGRFAPRSCSGSHCLIGDHDRTAEGCLLYKPAVWSRDGNPQPDPRPHHCSISCARCAVRAAQSARRLVRSALGSAVCCAAPSAQINAAPSAQTR